MPQRKASAIELTAEERFELESLARRHTRPGRHWRCGRTLCWRLMAGTTASMRNGSGSSAGPLANGESGSHDFRSIGCMTSPSWRTADWRRRDRHTIRRTLESRPLARTRCRLRSMAPAVGHAPSTIHRSWKAYGPLPFKSPIVRTALAS
jgi:hypothetical protein